MRREDHDDSRDVWRNKNRQIFEKQRSSPVKEAPKRIYGIPETAPFRLITSLESPRFDDSNLLVSPRTIRERDSESENESVSINIEKIKLIKDKKMK